MILKCLTVYFLLAFIISFMPSKTSNYKPLEYTLPNNKIIYQNIYSYRLFIHDFTTAGLYQTLNL